ncbi:MAG: hypothetical protein DWQ01_12570 [Planctomycetota bacterium]|nr:MAG: hypothetical protein DWQ01_12570 [Planctomycetota bacterium]
MGLTPMLTSWLLFTLPGLFGPGVSVESFDAANGGRRHAPHDCAYSLAVATLSGGGEELVVVTDEKTVLSSTDGLLTYRQVIGAGLEDHRPTCVSFNPTLPWFQGTGQGLFVIGTEAEGQVYFYQPGGAHSGTAAVTQLSAGMTGGTVYDKRVYNIVSADGYSQGFQPTFLLTKSGKVRRLKSDGSGWETVFDSGALVATGALAMAPRFRLGDSGPRGTIFVAVNEKLYVSRDSGDSGTWLTLQDMGASNMLITALAFDLDFGLPGGDRIYMGTSRRVVGIPPDEGHIFVSSDNGLSFQAKHQIQSTIGSIVCAPAGPTAPAAVFVTGREHPGANRYFSGVLRSFDQGDTWLDPSTYQCFLMEHDPGHASGHKSLRFYQELLVLPDYENRGEILYGRNEGLFLSEDEGELWREMPMRSPEEARNMEFGVDAQGNAKLFLATYGQGLTMKNIQTGEEALAEPGNGIIFNVTLDVSPNFATDGAAYVSGSAGVVGWFDPAVDPPVNSFGITGPRKLPLRHHLTNKPMDLYVRSVAVPPAFHADPNIGDNLIYFGAWGDELFKSEDGGWTYQEANTTASGQPLPYLNTLEFAPDFDSSQPHSDLYGMGNLGELMRMTADVWHEVANFNKVCNKLLLDPNYDSNNNRHLWVAADEGAVGVFDVVDDLSGPIITPVGTGLPPTRVWDMKVVDDGPNRWMYIATWSDGIWKIELTGSQVWQQLPMADYPGTWTRSVALSPNWATDKKVYAGTGIGTLEFIDDGSPGRSWNRVFSGFVYDSREASMVYFSGPGNGAPNPDLPWPWTQIPAASVPGGGFGEDARVTLRDGSYALIRGWARQVILHTIAGTANSGGQNYPSGEVLISVYSLDSGQLLASQSEDLGQALGAADHYEVLVDLGLPAEEKVEVRVEANLDPGEIFVMDAIEFVR